MDDSKQPLPAPAIETFERGELETQQVFTGKPSVVD